MLQFSLHQLQATGPWSSAHPPTHTRQVISFKSKKKKKTKKQKTNKTLSIRITNMQKFIKEVKYYGFEVSYSSLRIQGTLESRLANKSF